MVEQGAEFARLPQVFTELPLTVPDGPDGIAIGIVERFSMLLGVSEAGAEAVALDRGGDADL